MKGKRVLNILFIFLLFIMPLHYYICVLLFKDTTIDNIFRDFIIIVLFFVFLNDARFRIKRNSWIVFFNCIILVTYALISYVLWQYEGTFNILRTYLIPMLFFFVASSYNFTKKEFEIVQKLIVIELTIIATYGFIQAFVLGDDFAIKLGYPSVDGFLSSSSFYIGGFFGYQRNIGTFVSPNVCGALLSVALIVHLLDEKKYIEKKRWIVSGLLIVGILGTLSRSAILGFICAVVFFLYISGKLFQTKKVKKKFVWIIPGAFVFCAIVIYIDNRYLNGMFFKMVNSSFMGTVTGTDLSMLGHINDLFAPIDIILKHPLGLGFGINGPMALESMDNANAVESSIYLMVYEIGILPAFLFFVPYIRVIFDTIKNPKYKYYIPALVNIMIIVTYFLLPNVQTYEILFYSYMYMGFYYNPSVKKLYDNNL